MNARIHLLIIAGFLLITFNTFAQEIEWKGDFGGAYNDAANSIQATDDGGYIVAGYSYSYNGDVPGNNSDYWIVKLDGSGNIEWDGSYGGSEGEVAQSVQQTDDGGYIVAGWSGSNDGDVSGNYRGADYWIVKLDGSGSIEWDGNYGGNYNEEAYSIQQTDDGGYIVAGESQSDDGDVSGNNGREDYWIVKLDDSGIIEWDGNYGGSDLDFARSIQATDDGGYIVAGESQSDDGDVSGNYGQEDYWIVKLDDSGIIEWEGNYGGSEGDVAQSVQQTDDGGYIVAGWSESRDGDISGWTSGRDDYWIVKLDDSGNIEWEENYPRGSRAYSIQETDDGGYIVAGETSRGSIYGYDYHVVKLDGLGNLEWEDFYGKTGCNAEPCDDRARSVQTTNDGGYIVAGHTKNRVVNDLDYWIIKLSGEGSNDNDDTDPPASPVNLSVQQIDDYIDLEWDANSESDLAGYNLYRAASSFSTKDEAVQLNEGLLSAAQYEDSDVASGTTYYYAVTAVDNGENESGLSNLESITFEDGNEGGDKEVILAQYFEGEEFPPTDWSTQTTITPELWSKLDHNNSDYEPVDEDSRYAAMAFWTSEEHDEWLISPEFSLAEENSNPVLTFNTYYDSGWIANATMKLNIRTATNSEWTTIWEAEDDGISGFEWREVTIDLSEYTGTDNIQLGWQYVGADGHDIGIDNVEIRADGSEYPAEITVEARVTFGEAATPQNYKLVALPGAINEQVSDLMEGMHEVNWQAYWDDGSEENYLIEYDGSEAFNFTPGNGFWVTHQDTFSYRDTLSMVELNDQNEASIPLHEGWNIISNPLDIDVAWEEVMSVNSDSLQPIWGFDGSFSEASEFTSAANGEAFYFLNDQDLEELVIPYRPVTEKQKSSERQQLKLITIVNGQQTSSSSAVFAQEDQKQQSDVVAPPGGFEGASLRFTNSEEYNSKRTNFFAHINRKHQPEGQQYSMKLTANPDQPVVIKAEIMDNYQLEELALLDPQTGKTYDLLSPQGVQYVPQEKSTDLLLVMGDSQYLEEQQSKMLPEEVSIKPNYPNPFNPTTTLQFALPEQAEVRVQVYDIIGRQVATLINNEVRQAGIHSVIFDASRQASGLYFAVFEIGQQRFTQKMMLIK